MSANRIIEISSPSYLKTSKNQLLIQQEGQLVASIPLEDLESIILCNSQIILTQPFLQNCSKFKVPVIVCDEKHMPIGYYFSPIAHNLHSKILQCQIVASLSLKKQIWKTIVKTKILHQAHILKSKGKNGTFIQNLSKRVKSGDSNNHEAQAAAHYWPMLFGKEFKRDPQSDGINSLLNYGYAILRASTARALAGSGLSPSIGLFHRNQYNPFCLADDLMEVVRPLVDSRVFEISRDDIPPLNRETKSELLSILQSEVNFEGLSYFLTDALSRCAKSLVEALESKNPKSFKSLSL